MVVFLDVTLWILQGNVNVDDKHLLVQEEIQLVSSSHGCSASANHF